MKIKIKIVREDAGNYTFTDNTILDTKREKVNDNLKKTSSIDEKEILKTRSIDSKKSKVRRKNRISGGQIQQSHSSVYE
jgi:hypothetical protein